MKPKSEKVVDYWYAYYQDGHCTLCGNLGWIDSRGVKTPAGVEVGRVNWCICPNGQAIRHQVGGIGPGEKHVSTDEITRADH